MSDTVRRRPRTLEVHEHVNLRTGRHVKHSHHGGPFIAHAGHGPAVLTIDRDDWLRQTGLRGGGRKRFTTRPIGPILEDAQ